MRIGLDISQAVYGTGVSDYTFDLVHALAKVDPTNQYVLFGSSLRRSADLQKLFPGVKLFRFPPMFLHFLWNRLHQVNIENFIGPTDVFHSSDWTQPPSSAAKVTTVHDLSPVLFPEEMASGAIRNITAVHRARLDWAVRECDRIICVSHSTAADLKKLYRVNPAKIVVIPEALPTRHVFHSTPAEISSVRHKYGLGKYVMTIGTPSPRKNISRLANSYLKYRKKYNLPEKLVVVGGHGWGITDIPDDPGLVFTGYIPDSELMALLFSASVFAFPSLHEGFGLPVLEAFFCRVPVLTSNVSSLPEVAGQAAVLVDPADDEAIAHGIFLAMKNRVRLVAAGQKQLAKFSWENTARQTLMVYSQLC